MFVLLCFDTRYPFLSLFTAPWTVWTKPKLVLSSDFQPLALFVSGPDARNSHLLLFHERFTRCVRQKFLACMLTSSRKAANISRFMMLDRSKPARVEQAFVILCSILLDFVCCRGRKSLVRCHAYMIFSCFSSRQLAVFEGSWSVEKVGCRCHEKQTARFLPTCLVPYRKLDRSTLLSPASIVEITRRRTPSPIRTGKEHQNFRQYILICEQLCCKNTSKTLVRKPAPVLIFLSKDLFLGLKSSDGYYFTIL